MSEIKVILISFIAGCASFFYMMRTAKKKGMEEEKNKNLAKFYENIAKAKKTENDNRNLTVGEVYNRLRSRERNNKR